MSDSTFHHDLDALVRGGSIPSADDLTRFVSDLFETEGDVTMPHTLKLRIAADLGLLGESDDSKNHEVVRVSATDSRHGKGSYVVTFGFLLVATVLIGSLAMFRLGLLDSSTPEPTQPGIVAAIPTVSSSPEASPDVEAASEDWTLPISPEECLSEENTPLSEVTLDDYNALPVREYVVVGPADPEEASSAAKTARQFTACGWPVSMMSQSLTIEAAMGADKISAAALVQLQRQLAAGQTISAAWDEAGWTPADLMYESDSGTSGITPEDESSLRVPKPDLAVELADGRVVVPYALSTGTQGFPTFVISVAAVLVEENGEWKLDDTLPVCIGECERIWPVIETNLVDMFWLSPISPEECDTNTYVPDALTADEVGSFRSRQYRACEVTGAESDLTGPEFRVTEGDSAKPVSYEIAWLHTAKGRTVGDLQRIVVPGSVQLPEGEPLESWTTFQPASTVQLADGRLAVLQTTVRSSDSVGTSTGRTNPVITTALIWIVDGDSWLLDEQATVCLGNCDTYWNDTPATPVATAVDTLEIEECVASATFRTDITSRPLMPTHLRPGPGNGSGVSVVLLPADTPLQYLCDQQPTTDPVKDRMGEGQVWLSVRTADGTEGWIRSTDIVPVPDGDNPRTPTPTD